MDCYGTPVAGTSDLSIGAPLADPWAHVCDVASAAKTVGATEDDGELLHQLFTVQAAANPRAIAIVSQDRRWRYGELDRASNQFARYLRGLGVRRGDLIALLLPRTSDMYLAMLAVLKSGAAYLPLDPEDAPDRTGYILRDCDARAIVTLSSIAERRCELRANVIPLDMLRTRIAEDSAEPLPRDGVGVTSQDLSYVMYGSSSTDQPTGVPTKHHSVCNLIRAQQQILAILPQDRVYQGSSIASDASVQEIWLAFATGARIVQGGSQVRHAGPLLSGMLTDARITVLSCEPKLLAVMDEVVPTVRLLIVPDEACPADLLKPWCRPGRRVVNTSLGTAKQDPRQPPALQRGAGKF